MYAVASVLCKTLQMSFNVDPGVRYFSVGPTISALASAGKKEGRKKEWKSLTSDGGKEVEMSGESVELN
jgi:hypothetical protein